MSPRPTRLFFLAPGDPRKGRVEAIIWMRTCAAYAAEGVRTTLVALRTRAEDAGELARVWEHYAIEPSFGLVLVPTTMRARPSRLHSQLWNATVGGAYALVAAGRSGVIAHARLSASLVPWVLLRRLLPPKRRPKLVLETHSLPPARAAGVLRRVDLVVVNSRKLAEVIVRERGVAADRVLVVANSPNATPRRSPKVEARVHVGLPADRPIALHAGKLVPAEVELMLDATANARADVPDLLTVFVGGNPTILTWAAERVHEAGLDDAVMLTGFVPPADVAWYLAAADVLLLHIAESVLTFQYTTPSKSYDYMNAGRPIVAADLPLWEEIFGADGERAIRVQHDPASFAEGIVRALSLPDGGRDMVERAAAFVSELTWENRVRAILRALER